LPNFHAFTAAVRDPNACRPARCSVADSAQHVLETLRSEQPLRIVVKQAHISAANSLGDISWQRAETQGELAENDFSAASGFSFGAPLGQSFFGEFLSSSHVGFLGFGPELTGEIM
jgi:hypothetical protein